MAKFELEGVENSELYSTAYKLAELKVKSLQFEKHGYGDMTTVPQLYLKEKSQLMDEEIIKYIKLLKEAGEKENGKN
jgi:hypothetical protein